jgi:ABC-type nitrate/sulfonate/bicarbonate transport system substrate-binding protein
VKSVLQIIDAGGPHERVTVELMHRQRLFERFAVEFERSYVANGAEAVEMLMAGRGDVAMQVGFGPALAAISVGAPLRVVAGANLLTVHAVYSSLPEIRRLADLRGRTVGVGRLGALTHQLIYAALLKRGIDPQGVNFVPIGNSATIFRALRSGQVDAGFGETDVFENQLHYGVHALEDGVLWKELPEFPNQASFATLAAIGTKREALVRALAAHAMLYRFLQQADSWDEYSLAWSAALPESTLEEGRAQWSFYQRYHPFASNLQVPEASLAFLQQVNRAMGLQRHTLPAIDILDTSLACEAMELIDGKQHHES